MANVVKIFALGGLDENGKNMYVLEINGDIFVFEAGMKYPESSMPGIDMIIPDAGYLIKNKNRVKAYFISHGHDDIMGALPYVVKDVPAPIYCGLITSLLIKDAAKRFGVNTEFDFHIVSSGRDKHDIAGHEVRFFATTHSVSSSLGIAVETGNGLVVYTGDYIIDYGALPQYRTDVNLLAHLGNKEILCLLTESVACDVPGHTSPKHQITPIVENVFGEHNGRIICSFYSQNLFGIREAIDMAIKNKRKIFMNDDQTKQIFKRAVEIGAMPIPMNSMLTREELERPGNEDAVIIITGLGEMLFHTLDRIANGEEKGITIRDGDRIIIASPAVPGIEVVATKVIDGLYKTGASIINVSRKQVASMHAHSEDIKMILSLMKPKYYMPVKGEFRQLVANAQIAVGMGIGYNHTNCFVYDNGMVALFEDGVYKGFSETVENGEVLIDGLGIGDVGSSVINDRQKLADNGALILGITIDKKNKKIVAGPDVQMRGLIFLKDADNFLKDLIALFENQVQEYLDKGDISKDETKVLIRDKINNFVRRATGKDPMVLPVIIEIK